MISPLEPVMWRRTPPKPPISSPGSSPADRVVPNPADGSAEQPLIGKALVFKGDVSGTQDLTVNGQIEGTVSVPGHTVTVGRDGRVQGDILARVIRIEGRVEGNLQGEEVVFLGPSSMVHGDLITGRVSMEEGCEFKGRFRSANPRNR